MAARRRTKHELETEIKTLRAEIKRLETCLEWEKKERDRMSASINSLGGAMEKMVRIMEVMHRVATGNPDQAAMDAGSAAVQQIANED
jgi:predicted RNase H-like nuclease (RuvC/YqgF family)